MGPPVMRQFSILKMMIAIAVVGVSFGGFIWESRMAPEMRGHRPHCQWNLRNVVLAILGHVNAENVFPSGTWPNASLPPEKRLSWYASILPYLDAQELWEQLDKDQPWDHATNDRIARTRIGVLRCTESEQSPLSEPTPTQYIGVAGVGTDAPFLPKGHLRAGVFGYDRRTTLADIKDGTSQTMMVAESGRVGRSWLAGGPATVRGLDTAELPYIGPGRQFSHAGLHASGMNAAFADGSVRFVSDTINPQVLEALSTIAGGETLPENPFP